MATRKEMTTGTALKMAIGIATASAACLGVLFVVWYWTIGAVHPNWENLVVVAQRMNVFRLLGEAWVTVFVLLLPYFLMMVYKEDTRVG